MKIIPIIAAAMATCNTNKPKMLCFHGKFQSGAIFSNKIAGARRKLAREYDMLFLDGPVVLQPAINEDGTAVELSANGPCYGWWERDHEGKYMLVDEALDHVIQLTKGKSFDVVLGFSQGGTLATALALSGWIDGVKAVVTAGAPMNIDVLKAARHLAALKSEDAFEEGLRIPKLHLAGELDTMVPVESTRLLCEHGGNGELLIHEQGHLFPTRAARVNTIMDFLARELEGAALSNS